MKLGRRVFTVALGAALLISGCGDEGPVSGPGTLTAVLVSPNGAEGAAVISLTGVGIGEISAAGSTEVFSRTESGGVTVVLINEPAGELSFRVAVSDTTQKPVASIEEVAGPDDDLRSTLAEYTVEYRR